MLWLCMAMDINGARQVNIIIKYAMSFQRIGMFTQNLNICWYK